MLFRWKCETKKSVVYYLTKLSEQCTLGNLPPYPGDGVLSWKTWYSDVNGRKLGANTKKEEQICSEKKYVV